MIFMLKEMSECVIQLTEEMKIKTGQIDKLMNVTIVLKHFISYILKPGCHQQFPMLCLWGFFWVLQFPPVS